MVNEWQNRRRLGDWQADWFSHRKNQNLELWFGIRSGASIIIHNRSSIDSVLRSESRPLALSDVHSRRVQSLDSPSRLGLMSAPRGSSNYLTFRIASVRWFPSRCLRILNLPLQNHVHSMVYNRDRVINAGHSNLHCPIEILWLELSRSEAMVDLSLSSSWFGKNVRISCVLDRLVVIQLVLKPIS